ncbi:uncharacterized protein LOC126322710 [Schistocerca gregaria]|uniref:uncharacterized protein LOC126322710 n=1 Tax=Schistocerca gregaria TaxID=7010 RepID=UPI00211EF12E|nr:uncharacterized protein LOC126322710 [Schistocerca gregaria]XP_049850504.1 uncharacterized protein LOC126322710 [Schistocerca gregaria]
MSFRNFNSLSAPSQYGYYAILDGQSSFAPHPPNYHPMLQPAAQLDASEASPIGCAGPSVGGGGNKDSEPFRAPQYNNSYNSPLKTTSGYLHEPPLLYLLSNPGQPCLLPGDARLPQEYRPAPPRTSSDDSLYPQMVASYGLPPSKPPCYKGGEHASPSKGGGPAASRSSLLEEFRNIKGNRKFELKDAVDHFVEFSSDQYGSRFIQQKLEVATNEEKQMVFQEIFPVALQLMTDVFGNYVIQKFFEYGTNEQKKSLGDALEGNVLSLSLQMYGCRVVQKAFEVISVEQQAKLVRELNGFVLKCIKDQNGNHVIQKVIEQVPPNLILFVVDTFKGKVCSLAMHPYGCRVIQRILEHCSLSNASSCKGASAQLDILDELLKETPKLVQDQYGNYVVQHVLENGRQKDRRAIISHLEGKIVALSQHKFASNVIEKCVQYGSYDDRQMILQEIVSEKPVQNGNYLPLEIMMKDAYANYVVQKILEVCDNSQRNLLVLKIKPHLASLKKYTYAKHIIARLEKILGKPL